MTARSAPDPRAPNPLSGMWRGRRVGLLGGSFNPAHQAHLLVTRQALVRLGLDEVWWLVSPQNPLKSSRDMAPQAERLAEATRVSSDRRIRPTIIETALGTRFTVDTLAELRRRFPLTRFVWLMGADNLQQVTRWKHWTRLFALAPVAIFGRPTYSLRAMSSTAAKRFGTRRIPVEQARDLAGMVPPAWTFIHLRHEPTSATAIRAARRASSRSSVD
ncbi:nicotinate-nucleotide adenylyltransferase [Iodidimonas sp. SYSU 1G8]|uniref:nicotinate-nucleotide adenylyltransferase n=1 Tax=Iodidimonas sp. SYSU 1G8 TaxID=3133967 RepID=UPI0031FE6B2D